MFKFKLCNNGYQEFPFLPQIFFLHHVRIMLKNHIHHDLNSFKSKGCHCYDVWIPKILISPLSLLNQCSIDLTSFFNGIHCQILEMNDNYVNANVHKTMFSIITKRYPMTFPFFVSKALGESSFIISILEMKWMKFSDELLVLFGWGKWNPCERWTYKFVNELLTWTPKPTI